MFSLLRLSEAAARPWHSQEKAAIKEHLFGNKLLLMYGSNRDGGLFSLAPGNTDLLGCRIRTGAKIQQVETQRKLKV